MEVRKEDRVGGRAQSGNSYGKIAKRKEIWEDREEEMVWGSSIRILINLFSFQIKGFQ
ncbi:MAG: hypothetical protein WBB21_12305 [Saprospiraceae bacterium]